MPKEDFDTAPMVMLKFNQEFKELDYSINLNGPFDVTTPLTAIQLEAQAKGCAVFVQIALVPLSWYWGDQEEEPEGDPEDE